MTQRRGRFVVTPREACVLPLIQKKRQGFSEKEWKARSNSQPERQWVYVIEAESGGVKIGFTKNLARRLHDLQCGSPVKLKLYASEEVPPGTGPEIEAICHREFEDVHRRGEWFNANADEVAKHLRQVVEVKSAAKTSRFKNVYWNEDRGCWVAWYAFNGQPKIVGQFLTEIEAARCYDQTCIKHQGRSHGRLNLPHEAPAEAA